MFAQNFWSKHGGLPLRDIVNVDETTVYYDMPTHRIWCKIGEDSKTNSSEKHSDRLTAVPAACADGTKLPILFVLRGQPGGQIEKEELPTFPSGHVYAVQERAWMDESVWLYYLEELLKYEIVGPTAVVVDNLAAHVSDRARHFVDGELFSFLEELPPNTTSVCQPLDVGVMGPLKSKMQALWLREEPVTTAAEKRMNMIKRTIKAWESLSAETVRKSFTKALPRELCEP
ncbi:hypothetical protein Ae201684_004720 [Aphanomyces euteiches]|uniref:DDE-1 domain-containing protein n=1 Tax=Aphanomyces euteiches TaxID=100861 RepID=A0A6G0XH05_9STRA|nr:hypothetical protein Ae201684_004720 [Aphanomyces euteiches]KAH9138018.1 hypothetical protein AeRB84_017527 [Aphanomyces euteiches]